MMVNVLLIGNGAREHAVAEAVLKSPQNPVLFTYMKANNPGLAGMSEEVQIGSYSDLDAIKAFAQAKAINLAFIGPEDPLNQGAVDALQEIGVGCVGPTKSLARLETSKSFTRLLMQKYGIEGNPEFKVFESMEGIPEYLEQLGEFLRVILVFVHLRKKF